VQVRGGCAGRAEDRRRPAARVSGAEGEEARGALVDDRRHPDRRLAQERERERRRARAGRDGGLADPAARELLDQRRGERRVPIGCVHAENLDPMRLERRRVELDAEPGPRRWLD
jgi:hypothetical protein